jgi:hypothetical protein
VSKKIGFYEWLHNDKYGVYDVFDLTLNNVMRNILEMPVPEIVRYLAKEC